MKVIKCADVGFDCPGVIKAETEQKALALAAQHAKKRMAWRKFQRRL